jgi:hypothetical protein
MTFVRDIDTARQALDNEIEKLQSQANAVIEPMKKYQPYTRLGDYNWSAFHNAGSFKHGIKLRDEYFFCNGNSRFWSWDNFTNELYQRGLEHFLQTYDRWKKDNARFVEENEKISEHNQLQRSRVYQLMETIGIREWYSTFEYKTSRSRTKTEIKHKAGFVSDLDRITPNDNYEQLCKQVEQKYEQIKRFGEHKLKEAEAERAKKEAEEKEKLQQRELALLQAKYTPDDANSEIYEIVDVILSKNKYLMLAYWLEKNRGDWSDGYGYAETGLDGFSVETDTDREIEKELSDLVYDYEDVDGRIFRDCKWNYNVLYGMVEDEQLKTDLLKCQELEGEI